MKFFETSDGKFFRKEDAAQRHQDILDKKIKECDYCHGSGRNPYYSPHVGGDGSPVCHGCGGNSENSI